MEKKRFFLAACLLSATCWASAQVRVTGKVVSNDDGQPVVGASVIVPGTKAGTVTDIEGKFVLTVPKGYSKLRVSSIGMEPQVITAKEKVTVALQNNAKALDEVMVVAFGTTKKSAFTGSAATVDAKQLENHVVTNVATALAGSVPGLSIRGASGQPGSGNGSISIRGISSMYAGTDPLIIVDGAPYSASLSNISPDDIESVSVLKDAASAALYGARGASGVIIITTKKGKTSNAVINVDAKWGVSTRAVPDYDIIRDPGEYYEAYYKQLYNRNFYGLGQSATAANANANTQMLKDLVYNVYTVPQGQQLIGMNGKLNPNATLGNKYTGPDGVEYYLTPDDWQDMTYRHGLRQEYNVNASGGSDRASYYSSLGYLKDEGIIRNSDYDRITARLRADYQAKNWLKLGANIGFVHSIQHQNAGLNQSLNSTNLMYYASSMAPIYPAYVRIVNPDGSISIKKDQYGNDAYDYGTSTNNGYSGLTRPFLATGNPLGSNQYNQIETEGNQLNGTFTADVNITSWLKFNATSTINYGLSSYSDYENPFYGPKVGVNGELTKSTDYNWRTNHVQTLTFVKDFGPHSVTALLGHEYYKTVEKYLGATASGGFSPEIPELNAFAKPLTTSSYKSVYNVEGYFSSLQYNYAGQYFLSASYRRDASSRFAKENRWGNFWSVGAAWLLTKSKFLSDVSWLDELKLKASIGQQGNDNIGNWAYIDLYSLTKASDTSMTPVFYRKGNKDITWETTTSLNIGTEFSLFKGRLTGSLDFYSKKTTDLLFWLSVPESAGTRGYYGNVGDIRNNGVELTLTGTLIRNRMVDWTVTGNLAHNTTKILALPESKIADNGGFMETSSNSIMQNWYKVGGSLYNAVLPEYAGVDSQGQALYWVDDDLQGSTSRPGVNHSRTTTDPNIASKYEQGSMLPKLVGGFSTSIRVWNFDLSAVFDYQIGGKVFDYRYLTLMTPSEGASGAGGAIHKDYLKSWSPDNTSSNIPRWQYGDKYTTATSNRFLTNASYFNFQSFTVGFTLPKGLVPGISKIRVYAAGENLGFISARKGLDPRYSYDGSGSSVPAYSPARNISGGIQLTF